jgi:hypothetical protein
MGARYEQRTQKPPLVGREPGRIARTIGGLGPDGEIEGPVESFRLSPEDRDEWERECMRGASHGTLWASSMRELQHEEMDDLRDLRLEGGPGAGDGEAA